MRFQQAPCESPAALSLAQPRVISMEQEYWIGRQRSAIAMAHAASTAEARLIHYELAGRLGIKAAHASSIAPSVEAMATEGRRATLHLRQPVALDRATRDPSQPDERFPVGDPK